MSDLLNCQIADALEKCDWAGASIGNKALVSLAAKALRNVPVATPADATDEMVNAALAVDWDNEDERATVHNIWHAMTAKCPVSEPAAARLQALEECSHKLAQFIVSMRDGHAHRVDQYGAGYVDAMNDVLGAYTSLSGTLPSAPASEGAE
ncbi:hypothetical protein F9K91_02260 [Brucella tritici]|uniref:Uncharacterized protein n=1 Tax=Brucella tritici TaxID=94626 RepID=A0A833CPF3_9HYPH|nr:hypothetical protein [Brucella tritici]KAB2666783.1 hypothetical protein F9K91_02260 [Brucella tritici]